VRLSSSSSRALGTSKVGTHSGTEGVSMLEKVEAASFWASRMPFWTEVRSLRADLLLVLMDSSVVTVGLSERTVSRGARSLLGGTRTIVRNPRVRQR
jgi:hypothetical protein